MREALRKLPELGREDVSVIFVAHERSDDGLRRTRRLFTTLNRYAKPVSTTEKIALDEDDAVAITTRRLLDEVPLLRDRVSVANTPGLGATNVKDFTSLPAIYRTMDVVLRDKAPTAWSKFKRTRPDDEDLERYFIGASAYVNLLQARVAEVGDFAASPDSPTAAAPYRGTHGGHLLFRPAGLVAFVLAYDALVRSGQTADVAVARLADVPMSLAAAPWVGLIWDPHSRRMMTGKDVQKAVVATLVYGAVGTLQPLRRDADAVRRELAGLLGTTPEEAPLAFYADGSA